MTVEPVEHKPQISDHPHQYITDHPVCGWHRLPRFRLEQLLHMFECQVISGERNTLILVVLWLEKSLGCKHPNIADRNALQRFALQVGIPGCGAQLAYEARDKVLEKEHRTEDSPCHGSILGLLEQMVFDAMFADEMRDIGWIVRGGITTAIDGAVDKVSDVLLDGFINQGFTLDFFFVYILTFRHRVLSCVNYYRGWVESIWLETT